MKLRLRVRRVVGTFATPHTPAHSGVTLESLPGDEAPEFVAVGATPGRRLVTAQLTLDNLEQAGEFAAGGDFVVTLERIARP